MGFNNPSVSWPQLERALSGVPAGADGGDSPAWSRKR
ncbi:MAG: error-prone polymerase, partial [Actinomycetota bacterium]|nr:error-prone polymerase [Actinomycetota bacterium]